MNQQIAISVAARGCVVKNGKLLLVSNDGNIWTLPGGHVDSGETLPECAKREVYEETGYDVKIGNLIYCFEFHNSTIHKIECCFDSTILSEPEGKKWEDLGHDKSVTMQKFFSLEEMQELANLHPAFLKQGKWLDKADNKVYMGYE